MKKKKTGNTPSGLSMFKNGLGLPMNDSSQMYSKGEARNKSFVGSTKIRNNASGNPHQGIGGTGMGTTGGTAGL